MKKIQNKNTGLFNCKSFGVAALISFLWLGGAGSSFGQGVDISASAAADCSGSVTVSGNVYCGSCEGSPTVYIDLGHDGEPVEPSVTFDQCEENTFIGTYGEDPDYPEIVSLDVGINVLTPSDSCGELGNSVSVISSGGGRNVWLRTEYSHTPTGHHCPVDGSAYDIINWNVSCYCLPQAIYPYQETETTSGETPTDCYHLPGLDNGKDSSTDANYNFIGSNNDHWSILCIHGGCSHSCSLLRHIYDPLVGSTPGSDVAVETVTVTVWWTTAITDLGGGGSSYNWND